MAEDFEVAQAVKVPTESGLDADEASARAKEKLMMGEGYHKTHLVAAVDDLIRLLSYEGRELIANDEEEIRISTLKRMLDSIGSALKKYQVLECRKAAEVRKTSWFGFRFRNKKEEELEEAEFEKIEAELERRERILAIANNIEMRVQNTLLKQLVGLVGQKEEPYEN